MPVTIVTVSEHDETRSLRFVKYTKPTNGTQAKRKIAHERANITPIICVNVELRILECNNIHQIELGGVLYSKIKVKRAEEKTNCKLGNITCDGYSMCVGR